MKQFIIGEPIMENGDLCIFDTESGYDIYKRGAGKVVSLNREDVDALDDKFWNGLYAYGWNWVDLTVEDDDDIDYDEYD